jgi:uncharacterized delta-60 repeat protein
MVYAAFALLTAVAGVAAAAPGDLDASFGVLGRTTFDWGGNDIAHAVAVQPDGKIVVVGVGGPNFDFTVTRLNPDGSFDSTFDGDGTAGVDFGDIDVANAVALQPDGKIVIAGSTEKTLGADLAIARLRPDGSLDPDFNLDGRQTFDYGAADVASDVLVQPDGKIVVVGFGDPTLDVTVSRVNPDGSPDPTFDGEGTAVVDLGGLDQGYAAALQPDGKIVVTGYTTVGDTFVLRLDADGALDTTFDLDGKQTIAYSGTGQGRGIAVQPDGKIVVAGPGGSGQDFAVARLESNGTLDLGFAGDGARLVDLGGDDFAAALVLQPNGKIVVMGDVDNDDFALLRLHPDGSLDLGFDGVASALLDFVDDADGKELALQSDGKIVAVGRILLGPAGGDVAVARIEGDPVTTTTTLPPSTPTGYAIPLKLAVVKPGRLVKLIAKGRFTLPDPGDSPAAEGGTLSVTGTTGSVTFPLGAASWRTLGRAGRVRGYHFGDTGCPTVLVTPRLVKAVCRGSTGTLAVPEPGALNVLLTIGTGTRYCATCGGTPRGGAAVFRRVGCAAPPECP